MRRASSGIRVNCLSFKSAAYLVSMKLVTYVANMESGKSRD